MAEETKDYQYRRYLETFLRAPKSTHKFEIYRPDTKTWEPYDYSGAIEQWYEGVAVDADLAPKLEASLGELNKKFEL